MIIDCIADLHGHYPKLEGGDLLIVAGDLTASDTKAEYAKFNYWLDAVSFCYKKVILIAGNHDNLAQQYGVEILPTFCEYLCDSGTEFEYEIPSNTEWGSRSGPLGAVPYEKRKLKIWGSPWTKTFEGMNPHCKAFTCETEEELAEKWVLIPDDVDILVTHSPPQQVRDWVRDYREGAIKACGSESLRNAYRRIKPKMHVFGHIHEGYGQDGNSSTTFVNASHVNERYEPVNKPIRVEL
jgi:Icc-related predicted phosphoesterase